MKRMLCFFLLLAQASFAQQVEKQLKGIANTDEALEFVQANPSLEGVVFNIYSHYDTAAQFQPLFRKRAGTIFTQGPYTYKILSDTTARFSRVSYIYFDGTKRSRVQIDSLRALIVQQLGAGVPFKDLAAQYTMDDNPTGDTGWFTDGTMVPEFERALKKHKAPEVFTVDIPKRGWYYVVKKTFEPGVGKRLTVLRLKAGE